MSKLLLECSGIFSKDDLDLGRIEITEHAIEMKDAKPVNLPPRRVLIAHEGEEKELIEHNTFWRRR